MFHIFHFFLQEYYFLLSDYYDNLSQDISSLYVLHKLPYNTYGNDEDDDRAYIHHPNQQKLESMCL